MEQAITALGKDGFVGVYAANDGTAGGAIAAMKSAGIDPRRARSPARTPSSPAIQRILAGDQYMTVYKPIDAAGREGRRVGRRPARTATKPSPTRNTTEDNGKVNVPSLDPRAVAVTADKVKDTVVKDGFWKVERDLHRRVRGGVREARHQ